MLTEATILRLVVSQAFAIYFILSLIPLREPKRRSVMIVVFGVFIIVLLNALLITFVGLTFYIRFYFFTLTLPYIILGLFFSVFKASKSIFAVLTIQVIGNVAIINGLLASYIFYGENTPLIDTLARVITYIAFLPIVFKFIRPIYLKMSYALNNGWWVLNSALIVSYALAYFILFVPVDIFKRPEYFVHAYIGIFLSLLIYAIIFFLFVEIKTKIAIEHDKQLLSTEVRTLSEKSEKMNIIAFNDALTGIRNRYSLFYEMSKLIKKKQDFIIVFIDLDNFKRINDTYNHIKGHLSKTVCTIYSKSA
jgi:predicted signal transduction protein with EAL and GGDEF domain